MHKHRPGHRRPVTLGDTEYGSLTDAIIGRWDDLKDPVFDSKSIEEIVKIISWRLSRGWTAEQSFGLVSPPPQYEKSLPKPIVCAGKTYRSHAEFARRCKVPRKILYQRLARDRMTPEQAAGLAPPATGMLRHQDTVGLVYCIRHIASGRCYVGITIDQKRRHWQHFSSRSVDKSKSGTIQHAIATFGRDAFAYSIVEDNVPFKKLAERERYWIAKLGTRTPGGYNQNRGGIIGGFGMPVTVAGKEYRGLADVANAYKMSQGKLIRRLQCNWTHEQAVGIEKREPKTRTAVSFDLCGKRMSFPTVAAARRYFGLSNRQLLHHRKHNKSWADAILSALVQQTIVDLAEAPELIFPRRRHGRPLIIMPAKKKRL
jgi:hypothetical protein